MQKKNTEAYPQYLRALDINPALYRANVQIGRMYKEAYAFAEAETELQKLLLAILITDPLIANWPNYKCSGLILNLRVVWLKKHRALENMRKYLDLTDKSFDSRLRYAQFLVYAGDFVTLEKEVSGLNAPDANNPKTFVVLRMRGYSAVENKNFTQGLEYMNQLFARTQDASRIIGTDYLYLGKAFQSTGNDSLAVVNIIKAVQLDSTKVDALTEIGKKYFDAKRYDKAAEVYKKVVGANAKNPAMAMNYYWLGSSDYFAMLLPTEIRKIQVSKCWLRLIQLFQIY
jgi:tetratricopeptide (TPR) repeat protein